MVAVAYRRWSFTRGSNCKALTGKVLDWRSPREVVAYERWSHIEVRLYLQTVEDQSKLRRRKLYIDRDK